MKEITIGTDYVMASLLGEDTTAGVVDEVVAHLKNVVLPWRKDNYHPPRYVRMTATGQQVGVVDPHLGGYGNAHNPAENGWGFSGIGPSGQGASISGIEKVPDNSSTCPDRDKEMKIEAIEIGRQRALDKVDAFLRKEFPHMILLTED